MKRAWPAMALATLWLFSAMAYGQGGDQLSGEYLPVGADPAHVPYDAALRVVADGDGWRARFRGEDKRLLPVADAQLPGLFPGVGESRTLRCAAAQEFVLCSVAPGTYFPQQGFRIDSGYFSVIAGAGIYELERVR